MAPSRALSRVIAARSSRFLEVPAPCRLQNHATRSPPYIRFEFDRIPRYALLQWQGIRPYTAQAPTAPEAPEYLTKGELEVFNKLKGELAPQKLEVQDISGGCGSMYAINITSDKFKGLTVIKQHRLVNEVLKDYVKNWHGVQLRTHSA
ncbi:bola protein [Lineolata rhizophorae]|uniref:Bola protein n=1 Tax=Lineolata rhizophorae TaxID=578093 RepID=A0A6A6NY01_9PEZI|nr:bola protein [Lineolata rhizophorae]